MIPRIFLAPVHNITNISFRQLCYRYGAEFGFVPIVSAASLRRKPVQHVSFCEKDGIQLFGSEPEDFDAAAKLFSGKWIDINCGCPSPRALDAKGGAALLKNPERAAELVSAVKKHADITSVKMRLLSTKKKTVDFAKTVEKAGADVLFIHGRTLKQGFTGEPKYDWIDEVASAVQIPVVGNGNITSIGKGKQLAEKGGWHGFMIARAAMKNPSLFSENIDISETNAKRLLREYLELCNENNELDKNDIRTKAVQFFRGFPNSAKLRKEISEGSYSF